MAHLLNKSPEEYAEEKARFIREIRHFHDARGTPFKHLPLVDGKEVDLFQLYWLVTAHGGWEKVNSRSGWEEFVTLFSISESTANGALSLKQIYLRYLDQYEKAFFAGDEDDDNDNSYYDEEDTRSRRHKSQKVITTVPCTYNHQQHNVPDDRRLAVGLSLNTYKKSDYDRLVLSLSSPLPNEQDFGINVCTLLSNEGNRTLKLNKCPRLLDLLLAHAGVFNHVNLKTYMNEFYKEAREYDLLSFWSDVCRDKSVRDLMLKFEPQSGVDKKRKSRNVSKRKVSSDDDDIEEVPRAQTSKERLEMLMDQVEDEMSRPADQGDDLFAQGRDLGTRDLAGQRILQIATVIWNLSFEEDNALILSKNLTCLRFCLLCCSSQWRNLNQMGFDILCNVATEVYLGQGDEDCVTDVLLSTLTTCIGSNDRFQVLSSLNILNKLCQQEVNENYIETVLSDQRSVFDQLISYLSLQDIHLLINTLECLFSLSSLGEHSCNAIVRSHGALEALVSLITAEARGYGPKACVLMRVVETTTTPCHGQWQQAQQQAPQQQPQSVQQQQHPKQLQPQQLPPKVLPAPVSATNPIVVSSAGQAIAVAPGGGVVVRPQQQQVILQPQVLQQQQPGQQLGKPIAIQPAPQTLPAGSIVRMAGGQIIQTPQQPGTPQIVRGQLAQVPGGTPRQVLHLPRHPIPVRPAGGTPVQVVQQQQQQAQVAQPQQIRPLMPGQQTPITTMGQPIRLQIQQPARPQIITQQAGQPQTIQRQPQPQSQPLQQPQLVGQQQQPQPQQTGSQAVQLRILNDEANRQFCLSWLKSTYELHSGNNIQHDMMYKQYLACLHKLYKTHVVSHQHYDACVRSVFGGSVGPNKRQLPDGRVEQFFEGVKIRSQPLPIPSLTNNAVVVTNTTAPAAASQNSLHIQNQTPGAAGTTAASLPMQQHANGGTTAASTQPTPQQAANNSGNDSNGQQNPGSPILTNLLHRRSPVPGEPQLMPRAPQATPAAPSSPVSRPPSQQSNAPRQISSNFPAANQPPNSSVLDGILPKDAKFGKAEADSSAANGGSSSCKPAATGSNGMLANLLEKKPTDLLNGGGSQQDVKITEKGMLEFVPSSPANFKKMNGGGVKRPGSALELVEDAPPNKHLVVQQNVVTNGVASIVTNGSGGVAGHVVTAVPKPIQQVLTTPDGQQVIKTTAGQPILLKAASGSGQVAAMVAAPGQQPGGGKGVVFLQPQNGTSTTQINNAATNGNNNHRLNGIISTGPASATTIATTIVSTGANNTANPSNSIVVAAPPPPPVGGVIQPRGPPNQQPAPQSNNNQASQQQPQSSSSSASSSVPTPSQSSTPQVPQPSSSSNVTSTTPLLKSESPTPTPPSSTSASASSPSSSNPVTIPLTRPNPATPYACDWRDCTARFKSPKAVENHALKTHCPEGQDEIACQWLRCDGMKRKRFSLMTHIQDRHCHPQLMKLMAVRRAQMANTGKSDIPLPLPAPPTPEHAPNAALHAIKKHAEKFVAFKARAMADESEGPVTTSIRLTSSLILKNLVIYSSLGKMRLKAYESYLSTVALSNVESSRTVSQILYEIADSDS